MTDRISKEYRSWNMSRIRSKDTKPERVVRSLLHSMGYRFRLHRKDLPGSPDIVLPKYKTVIFVHGCFWHRHEGCPYAYVPASRTDFWHKKFQNNIKRDAENLKNLSIQGWKAEIIWECQTRDLELLRERIRKIFASH